MDIKKYITHPTIRNTVRMIFWFSLGAALGLFFFMSFVFIWYQKSYKDVVYPGVFVNGIDFGGKSKLDVKNYFAQKNDGIAKTKIYILADDAISTTSARELQMGFDADLLAEQAFSIGRSKNTFSDITLISQAYLRGISLTPSYHFSIDTLQTLISPLQKAVDIEPMDAQFTFENNRVVSFKQSQNGQQLQVDKLQEIITDRTVELLKTQQPTAITIRAPITVAEPKVTTEKVNDFGIKELLASGTSVFPGSIQNRIYNLTLAASRVNGVIVKPGEIFSFNKTIGDVSKLTGYKEAYVIQNGRTVLGDGGGVCQVSTTLFRALLNAGLPIVERNQHAYRVHYYEEDSAPGIDAAIYTPNVDLRFRNDTKHHLLIQAYVIPDDLRLTFEIYGTSDGRVVELTKPIIHSQTPAPEPLYQDDPNLPKGEVKQVDWAAPGARVSFTRVVKRDGKTLYNDTFASNYRPWQAVYLRGTKEN
jgi:vancomycin resistance protein YoaR